MKLYQQSSTLKEQSQRQYQHLDERIKNVKKTKPLESSADYISKCFEDQREVSK